MKKIIINESIFDSKIKNKLKTLTEGLFTEVDKETWSDPEEISNEDSIEVDGEVANNAAPEKPESAYEYIMGSDESTPEDNSDDLSNEEKKALILKLAKSDNDLDAILADYFANK